MFNYEDLRKIIIPLLKGLPVILAIFLISLFLAIRAINYSTPLYQSVAKIRIDDQRFGFSKNNLFTDFDVFSTLNKIESEVELMKSQVLLRKVISELDFSILYFRMGKIRNTEMYNDSPFKVEAKLLNPDFHKIKFFLTIKDSINYQLNYQNNGEKMLVEAAFGDTLRDENMELVISRTVSTSKLIDNFYFEIPDVNQLIALHTKHLEIAAVDKDLPVIRISNKNPVPEKTAMFINQLAETYIEDYIQTKSAAANETHQFIDEQLQMIGDELSQAERDLEQFKLKNKVVNTRQETETGLRKLSQLNIQLTNLDMNERALQELTSYIEANPRLDHTAPNFGFGDLLFTELLKKIKQYEAEKAELLLKFKPDNPKVKIVDEQIESLRLYVKDGIRNAEKDLSLKKAELQVQIDSLSHQFDNLPTREKQQLILERNFRLKENIYNFLSEKKIEASIAAAPGVSFHRIIQYATVPEAPVSPNKTLIMFVSGLLGLFVGIAVVLIFYFSKGQINSRQEIEKKLDIPIAGQVRRATKNTRENTLAFITLAKNLELAGLIKNKTSLVVTSSIQREGKTYTSENLAMAFASMGKKVVYVDFTGENAALTKINLNQDEKVMTGQFKLPMEGDEPLKIGINRGDAQQESQISTKSIKQLVKLLKARFDIIIFDALPTTMDVNTLLLMQIVSHALYVIRNQFTKSKYIYHAAIVREEYKIDNISLLINDVRGSVNFSGHFSGAPFTRKSFWHRLINWIDLKPLKR